MSDNNNVQKVKEALSIETVVASYIKLEHAGKNFKARCPFHNEKTPSFYVTPDRATYKCFGCGKGGDIFSFVQEIEGVDFYSALKLLAEKAGVTLTRAEMQSSNNNVLYDIMDSARKWYEVQLRTTPEVVNYLLTRGLTKESMANFHIGYAPLGWSHLCDMLRARGFSDADIRSTGLGIEGKNGGTSYDRFRERIMFPIADSQGRTVAFSGRIFQLAGSTTDISQVGKYINSPEGALYDKSRILYGYDRAKRFILSTSRAVVVEGQIDLVMAHQAGVLETVALSGTALTPYHCELIKRFTDKIILALDGDEAGLKAIERSVFVAYDNDLDVQVVLLPNGKDPADIIQESGPDRWKELLDSARDYIEVRLALMRSRDGASRVQDQFIHIREHIFPFIQYIHNTIFRDAYFSKIASMLSVDAQSVRDEFLRWNQAHPRTFNTLYQGENKSTSSGIVKNKKISYQDSIVGIIETLALRPDISKTHIQPLITRYETIIGEGAGSYAMYKDSLGEYIGELITMSSLQDTQDQDHYYAVLESIFNLFELELLQQRHKDLRMGMQTTDADHSVTVQELENLSKKIDALKLKINTDEE